MARARLTSSTISSRTGGPSPSAPLYITGGSAAGTYTTPAIGAPPLHSPMFTVNWPLRLMNSFVPSSGSTHQKYSQSLRAS